MCVLKKGLVRSNIASDTHLDFLKRDLRQAQNGATCTQEEILTCFREPFDRHECHLGDGRGI